MTRSDLVATMLNRCSPAIKDHTRLRTMGRKRLKGDPGHERQARSAREGRCRPKRRSWRWKRPGPRKAVLGKFESDRPGCCCAQDTFYVGNLESVGRVNQQTFIDAYAKVACAKLYHRSTPITAADLLNDGCRRCSRSTKSGCCAC